MKVDQTQQKPALLSKLLLYHLQNRFLRCLSPQSQIDHQWGWDIELSPPPPPIKSKLSYQKPNQIRLGKINFPLCQSWMATVCCSACSVLAGIHFHWKYQIIVWADLKTHIGTTSNRLLAFLINIPLMYSLDMFVQISKLISIEATFSGSFCTISLT